MYTVNACIKGRKCHYLNNLYIWNVTRACSALMLFHFRKEQFRMNNRKHLYDLEFFFFVSFYKTFQCSLGHTHMYNKPASILSILIILFYHTRIVYILKKDWNTYTHTQPHPPISHVPHICALLIFTCSLSLSTSLSLSVFICTWWHSAVRMRDAATSSVCQRNVPNSKLACEKHLLT